LILEPGGAAVIASAGLVASRSGAPACPPRPAVSPPGPDPCLQPAGLRGL